ncbi:MAG TPA: hypothetical protein VJN72_07155 [Gaiellales bacterium]|nr:hypothetical protein [Gaiellales bacterium]
MSAMYNLRLPASELAKLEPLRRHDHADSRDVVRPPVAPDAANAVARRRPRPAHRLSGFARA